METTKTIIIRVDASRAVDGSASATRALANLERQTATMGSTLDRMEQSLGKVGGYLKAQLAILIAQVGARLVQMARDAFTAVSGLDELAEQLGITTRGLQALQFSAVQNGLKLEQLETGISKFSQKIGEAAGGSKEMIEALQGIGVKILDAQGRLRPTEQLLTEVARAIVAIDDPAKRAAVSVDFFGKAGTRLLPTLKDIAGGMDDLAERARRAGVMISAETIAKLDKLDDSSSRAHLKIRALFAETMAGPLTAALEAVNRVLDGIISKLDKLSTMAKTARENAPKGEADIQYGALQERLANQKALLRISPNNRAAQRTIVQIEEQIAALDWVPLAQRQASYEASEAAARAGSGNLPANLLGGAGGGALDPNIKGAGDDIRKRIAKLDIDTTRETAAASAYADASERGARAVADLEIHFKALKAAQDAYGETAAKNATQVQLLTEKLEEEYRAAEKLKNLKDFNLGTENLREQNELLEAENRLIGESAEVRARELALIKLKQEAQRLGINADTEEGRRALAARKEALITGETLKAQGEELRKAQELWTEPLKRALQDIQSTAADAFETMLEKGDFSFKSLADTFGRIIRRMAAEFLALATVRPVMSVLVNAIGPSGLGIIGGGTASQLFPGGGSSLISSGGFSGGGFGGLGSIFGGSSGGGGWLSGLGSWLGSPIFGASNPAGMAIPHGATATGLNSLTWGQGLGSLASIGMGAYNLFSGGGSTGSTISGIGQIAGGIVSLIPGGQVVGPLISLASSLFGGLFGDSGPKIPPMPPLVYGAGEFQPNPVTGSYYTAGRSLNGGSNLASAAGSIGDTVQGLFRKAGLTVVPSRLIGGAIHSGTGNNLNNGQWSPFNFTTADVIYQDRPSWRLFDTDATKSVQQASEFLASYVFRQNVLEGGVTGAGPALTKALASPTPPTTLEGLNQLITMADAYDRLGKAANPAKDQIDQLSDSFAELQAWASKVGLSLEPINTELAKQSERLAQDFIDGMLNPLAVQLRALEDEKKNALTSAEYIKANFANVFVDLEKITEHFNNRRLTLEQQYYGASVQNLEALIKRLTYGDLANASPDTSLAGTRASYTAALAQARAGDATAIGNLTGYAEAYANTARNYFASGPEYAALVAQMRRDLEEIVARTTGGTSGGTTANLNQATAEILAANDQLREIVSQQSEQITDLKNMVSSLVLKLGAIATNRL